MSRKTKLSTVAQKLPKQKTFEGRPVPYQFLDEEKQIAKALEEDKVATKERELVEKELEKPYTQRNKALMSKYSGTAREVPNGWPADTSSGGYEVVATAFDDVDTPISARPMPWFVTIKIPDHGNSWTFRFPLKRELALDGAEIYKLDGMATWIYPDGTVIDSLSDEETPYSVLRKVLKSPPGGTPLHFNFPGFNVRYKRDASTVKNQDGEIEKPTAKIQHVTMHADDDVELIEGSDAEANRLLKLVMKNGVDIAPAAPVKKGQCRVTAVACGKARSDNMWLYFEGIEGKFINSTILSGAAVAARYLGLKRVTAGEITAHVAKSNAEVRKQL